MTDAEKTERRAARLERDLKHAIDMERKAGTRVRRAATVLQRWQSTRRRIESRIGAVDVQRIVNRLTQTGE